MSRLRNSLLVSLCISSVLFVTCTQGRRLHLNPNSNWGDVSSDPDLNSADDYTLPNPESEFDPATTRENQWRKSRLSWGFDVQDRCPPGQVWKQNGSYCSHIPDEDDEYGR